MEESQIEALRAIGLSDNEIANVASSDKAIDKGEKLFNLTPELEVGAKKARQAERKPNAKPITRQRKQDVDKRVLLQVIGETLCDMADNVEVTNPEREIIVMYNGRKFKVVLSAPRT